MYVKIHRVVSYSAVEAPAPLYFHLRRTCCSFTLHFLIHSFMIQVKFYGCREEA